MYQQERRQINRQAVLEPVKGWVGDIRRLMPRVGTRKLYYLLKPRLMDAGIKMGRDALFHYLGQHQLLVQPKRSYTKTTNSRHWMKKYPNLLSDLSINQPEQVFVSDITYVVPGAQGRHGSRN